MVKFQYAENAKNNSKVPRAAAQTSQKLRYTKRLTVTVLL